VDLINPVLYPVWRDFLDLLEDDFWADTNNQIVRPDADLATTGWTPTPLHTQLSDESDATVITATLS
jgi:hypothetical protein